MTPLQDQARELALECSLRARNLPPAQLRDSLVWAELAIFLFTLSETGASSVPESGTESK